MPPLWGQAELQDVMIIRLHNNVCCVTVVGHGAFPQSLAWIPFVYKQLFLVDSQGIEYYI